MSAPAIRNTLALDDPSAGPANRVPARRACLVLGAKPRIVANRTAPRGVPRVVVPPLVAGSARAATFDGRRAEVTAANQKQESKHQLFHTVQHAPILKPSPGERVFTYTQPIDQTETQP